MDEQVKELMQNTKEQVDTFLMKYIRPRVEHQIDIELRSMVEEIIEKKIEERFSFAIELLRSMNEKAKSDGR